MDRKNLVNQSIDYIMGHLDEDLSLDRLAAHVYISKFHFSRIFKEETGESVYAFIKRCKVDQSAVDLKLNPTKAITDIGLDYGYSASNYSTVFKERHHTSLRGTSSQYRLIACLFPLPRSGLPASKLRKNTQHESKFRIFRTYL